MSNSSLLRLPASTHRYGLLAVTTFVCASLCVGLYLLLSLPSISPAIAIYATAAVAMAVAAILLAASQRWRFSMRSLFVLIALVSLVLAALSMSVRDAQHKQHVIGEITALGGKCLTLYGTEPSIRLVPSPLVSRDLTNVYRIDLSGSNAVDKDLSLLRAFGTKLRRIDIDGSHVTVDSIIRLFEEQGRSCAEALSAIGFEIEARANGTIVSLGDSDWELMEQVLKRPEVQDIENLNLAAAHVSDQELPKLANLRQLKELDISLTQVTDIGLRELGSLTKLERIRALDTQVTLAGIKALIVDIQNRDVSDALKAHGWTTRPGNSLTQTLFCPRFDVNLVRDEDLKEIGQVRSLNTLLLNSELITDHGLDYLKNLDELRSLYLRNTQITSDGLSKLSGLAKLRKLELTGSKQVTNEALLHLPNRDGIEWLGLIGTGVDRRGLAYLHEIKSLKVLYLSHSNGVESAIADLRQALPDTGIEVSSHNP